MMFNFAVTAFVEPTVKPTIQMKRIFIIFCLAILTPVLSVAQTTQELAALESEIEADLTENILPYWMNNAVDPDGGFYGFVSWDNKPRPQAPKGAILNARILWTFSRAYRCYGLEEYKEIADRAADYFKSHFIDRKYGGVVWSVNSEGAMLDGTKQTYANAFGIYGLAEHFRATGNVASLNSAIDLFRTLEEKTHDKVRKGYIETHERDWSPTSGKGVDGKAGATKTMNTHIHVMEAYSNLYQAWPDEALKDALYELVGIVQNELYDADGRTLVTFCDDDWNPINPERSAGHDIETAWLLTEAVEILGDETLLESARKRAVEMTDAALEAGFQKDGGMLSSRSGVEGEFSYAWWCQNEAVNGCINAWQITGDRKYFDAAAATWGYIKQHFIDRENGGWHMEFDEDGTSIKSAKISEWNCPYHNSRMGFEAKSRLVKPSVHTEVMAWSNITGVRLEGELIDFESSLRVGTPGGEIESSGREKQNKIRYDRQGDSQITTTPMHGAIFNQTVTDVDMSTVNLKWSVEATETIKKGAYFCMSFAPKYYSDATVRTSGRKITIIAPERNISLTFNKPVKSFLREEDGNKVLYVTFLPKLLGWLGFYIMAAGLMSTMYKFIPATKVLYKNAFWSAVVSAAVFAIFQYMYLKTQFFVARLNGVYGAMAAIPLFLMWVNFSWQIIIYGEQLCYGMQNVDSYHIPEGKLKDFTPLRDRLKQEEMVAELEDGGYDG